MASVKENPDTTSVKVDSSSENGAQHNPGNQNRNENSGNQDNFRGNNQRGDFHSRRGGGRFGPGNRRPNNQNFGQNNDNNFRGMKRPRGGGFQGPNGGGPRDQDRQGGRHQEERWHEKLGRLFCGPTYDLPPIDTIEKKFAGRARLYVGNIANEITEDELNELFKKFGETHELFYNKEKNFAFIRVDYYVNAEKAKRELDGFHLKGKTLKIRFAPCGSTIKVSNLNVFVSNELLYHTFSIFGEIERCTINVDDRGKSTGEAVIEFARKGSAASAIRKCTEDCLFLTASLRPVFVEQYDVVEDTEGYPEKNIPRRNHDYMKEREVGPRFPNPNSFEHEYGLRWKQLHELHVQKVEALKHEYEMEKGKLEKQMDIARNDHETEMLREQLRAREMDRDRQKRDWEMKEQQAEELRIRNEEMMKRQMDDLQSRMQNQEKEISRRQAENDLFMQAHQLNNILDQQEQDFFPPNNDIRGGGNGGFMASMELIGRKKYSCKYPGCNNHYYTNIKGNYINKHFFRFPKNVYYHQVWRNVCNVASLKNTTNYQICEDHFSPRDFMNEAKQHLIQNAVPLPCLSEISNSQNSNFLEVIIDEEVNKRRNSSVFLIVPVLNLLLQLLVRVQFCFLHAIMK